MTIELLRDTVVRFPKGAVIEVSDEEAKRLASLGNAKAVVKEEKKPAPKKAAKKKDEN